MRTVETPTRTRKLVTRTLKIFGWLLFLAGSAAVAIAAVAWRGLPRFSYLPPMETVVNPQAFDVPVIVDTTGRSVDDTDARSAWTSLFAPREGEAAKAGPSAPRDGDVIVDSALLALGRTSFYRETFGNEVFLTDVMGILDGPIRWYNVAKAVIALDGAGTTNLEVELAESITIGGKTWEKGSLVSTGLDVPAGEYAILGMPFRVERGRVLAGMTCAACHSTVDPESKKVIDGAINSDLASGLLLAFATNSAAYFPHSEVPSLEPFVRGASRTVLTSDGRQAALPDVAALEASVDEVFASWPPGFFDSTIDLKADATHIPDSFTLGDHPYGWSGFAAVGPFLGLATLCNNVHAQNSDTLAHADLSLALFGIDKEVYVGTILQNAASPKFRFDPAAGKKPSEFFASVDPTPDAPGMNQLVKTPGYPEISWIAPSGLLVGSADRPAAQQVNAMAAWQNTLAPPRAPIARNHQLAMHGRKVFEKAVCSGCHAGPALTNNKVVAAPQIATEPTRALAFQKTQNVFGPPLAYTYDTPVPLPAKPRTMLVNMRRLDPNQLELAWAQSGTMGGYKVPSLVGLWWSAPYLHDGGVAVGANDELGVSGTLMRGVAADPVKSLTAFVDRKLRALVVGANDGSTALQKVRVRGSGHEHWADMEAGFSEDDQRALVHYLLTADTAGEQEELTDSPPFEKTALARSSDEDWPGRDRKRYQIASR